jgi:hypothetical protein
MRIFYILLSIILLSTAQVKSQSHLPASPDPDVKIIKFYPNPAISVITFDFQKAFDKTYSFQIFNFLGKKVYEAPAVDQKTLVNLSDYFRGIYIFQLKDQSGKVVETGKFQVAK